MWVQIDRKKVSSIINIPLSDIQSQNEELTNQMTLLM